MIFDASCLVWQESCGERGACWIYDSESVSKGITSALVITKSSSCICAVIALCLYKKPEDGEEEGDIIKEEIIVDDTIKDNSEDTQDFSDSDKGVKSGKVITNGDITGMEGSKDNEVYMNGGYAETETTQL